MNNNRKHKKFISMIVCCSLAVLILIVTAIVSSVSGNNTFAYLTQIKDFFVEKWSIVVKSIVYIIFAVAGIKLIDYIMHLISGSVKSGATAVLLINSFVKYAILLVALFGLLRSWGVDTTTLLASAGILALIIGLGAQSLIEDIISGLFIVFEKEFEVGDIVVVDNFRGSIKEIGIRTTQIIDVVGNIKTINNSEIRNVVNLSNDLSVAICDVDIEYGESIEKVETIISQNLEEMKKRLPLIVEGPFYKGVSNLGASGVTIRLVAKCEEADRFQAERDMNREIKLIFDRNNINIPFTQIVINTPQEINKTNKDYHKEAEDFISKQQELSKNIDKNDNNGDK